MTNTQRAPKPKPRRMFVSIPDRAGPHVRLEEKSGVRRPALKAWRYKNYPSLQTLEAALQTLGWDLIPLPRDRVIDPDILEELRPIADRLGLSLGDAVQFASEIAVEFHARKEAKVAEQNLGRLYGSVSGFSRRFTPG
jgi:hypothetical protein